MPVTEETKRQFIAFLEQKSTTSAVFAAEMSQYTSADKSVLLTSALTSDYLTALHICAIYNPVLIPTLLAHGAKPLVENRLGRDPYSLLLDKIHGLCIDTEKQGYQKAPESILFIQDCINVAIELIKHSANIYATSQVHAKSKLTIFELVVYAPLVNEVKFDYIQQLLELSRDTPPLHAVKKHALFTKVLEQQILRDLEIKSPDFFSLALSLLLLRAGAIPKENTNLITTALCLQPSRALYFLPLFLGLGCESTKYDRRYLETRFARAPSNVTHSKVIINLQLILLQRNFEGMYSSFHVANALRCFFPGVTHLITPLSTSQPAYDDGLNFALQKAKYLKTKELIKQNLPQILEHINEQRKALLLFIIYLVAERNNPKSTSTFKPLPLDIIREIMRQAFPDNSAAVQARLLSFISDHYANLKEKVSQRAAVTILQDSTRPTAPSFRFFPSAASLDGKLKLLTKVEPAPTKMRPA